MELASTPLRLPLGTEELSDEVDGPTTTALLDRLLPEVYLDLREVARRIRRRHPSIDATRTTALVHNAYLDLRKQRETYWTGREHLLGVAATLMRRILADRLRARDRIKRGGASRRVELQLQDHAFETDPLQILRIDEAIELLKEHDPRKARLVDLRFFAGLSLEEAAEVIGVSVRTAKRDWAVAKLFLLRELEREETA